MTAQRKAEYKALGDIVCVFHNLLDLRWIKVR